MNKVVRLNSILDLKYSDCKNHNKKHDLSLKNEVNLFLGTAVKNQLNVKQTKLAKGKLTLIFKNV